MADELNISSDLTSQFAQLGDIKSVSARLSDRLAHISQLNHTAAGTDDDYATAYHKNVDANQQNLVDLVDGIGSLFETTGDNGQAVAKSFDRVNDEATTVVGSMHMDSLPLSSSFASPLSPALAREPATARLSKADVATTFRGERVLGTPATALTEPATVRGQRVLGTLATPATPLGEATATRSERMLATPATPATPLGEATATRSERMLATPATPATPLGGATTAPVDES